jgi:predicted TIM-barrel fold metal-dependent hydrolase
MSNLGVDYYAVSSTTVCAERYDLAVSELQELIRRDKQKVLPIMWITPDSLNGNIAWCLESKIKWTMLKVHPYLHPSQWNPDGSQFSEVIDIANEFKIPILIHTGDDYSCESSRYEKLIKANSDVVFILAHGRPIDQAIKILDNYNNVYVDTAFMSAKEIPKFLNAGLEDRILWGSDMCIPKYFRPKADLVKYYNDGLHKLRSKCTLAQFEKLTYLNAAKLFKIENNP